MTTPNIIKGQIALDPTNDLLHYVNESDTIVSVSLSWLKNNSNISTIENVVIGGDLTVSGSTVTVNTETLLIEDNIIILNTGTTGSPTLNAGVEIERGTSVNVQIRWNESTDKWQFTNDGTTFYDITGQGTTSIEDLLDVTISSATNGDFLRYNGSVWINDAVNLGTDTTGNFVSNVSSGNGITVTHTPGEASSATVAVDTSVVATLSDTQILTNKTLATPSFTGVSPKISLTGDLFGNVTLNNLQNGILNAHYVEESVILGFHTSGDFVGRLYAGPGVEVQFDNNSVAGASATLSVGQRVDQYATPNFVSVTAENFYGNLSGNVTGNVTSATNVNTTNLSVNSFSIDPTGATDGKILKYNSSLGKFVPADDNVASAGSLSINDLNDVDTTGKVNGQYLRWDQLSSNWIADDIDPASNVALGSSTTGNYVKSVEAGNGIILSNNSGGAGATPTFSVNTSVVATLNDNQTLTQKTLTSPTITGISPVITLAGDLTGSGTLTNLGDATLTATIAANSVALGTDTTGDYVSSLVAGTGITLANNSGENSTPTISIGQAVNTNSNVTFDTVTTTGNITVGGNISVTGSLITTNQTSLSIEDPIIYLNNGATPTDPDLGFAGNYNDGTYRHAGLFSDASDGHKFKFFKGLTIEPTHPINTAHASYADGDVVANTFESKVSTGSAPLVIASTTLVSNLNAQYLNGQASTYYAPTASPTFTGTVTLPANTVTNSMIASNTIDYSKLASGPATSNFNIIFNDQVGSYTLVAGDLAKMVTINSSSNTIVTVPNILSTGDQITVLSKGTGTVELTGDTGVTVNATPGSKLRAQWSSATLVKLGNNSWLAIGDLKA